MDRRSLGKNPSGERLKQIQKSPNYHEGHFRNVEPTSVNPDNVSIFKILFKMLNRPAEVRPSAEIPHIETDLQALHLHEPVVVWFGHSSYLIKIGNFTMLVDPVFSGNASPSRFFGKAFDGADSYNAEDIPALDLLLITHDHYDHLDRSSIVKLLPKTQRIITSLGVGAHLEYWGVPKEKITELDWWQSTLINKGIEITATPARHFSGRGFNRGKTLWSSFVLNINDLRVFVGADSGYDMRFREIGRKYGPFDFAFLECGQYNEYWPQIHMFPEETVKAAKDLDTKVLIPVHWGKFVLSMHPWNEPVKRLVKAADEQEQKYLIPQIGEPFYPQKDYEQVAWWEF
ncbi:MBL fold metallo-hydrolase [Salinimicrobium flavum]|uniref:MBL fold metallo-hydrolase n=1 Tax=Salinimicrobium flavum TaxID=1737065 RepID=A0ABW5IZQ0_9FLAO